VAETGRELVERFGRAMERGDLDELVGLYSHDAMIVSYSRLAVGGDQIRELYVDSLASHGRYKVDSINQFRDAGDLVMWDGLVETQAGFLETTHVVLLDGDGRIRNHVPGVRGYWGM
jgi:ketosteroid isomerase-like protein